MYNPFKNTYKIVELSNLNEDVSYNVKYGNFLCSKTLDSKGYLWYNDCILSSGKISFQTLNEVKAAIKLHEEKELEKRLAQITTKTIARI